jgi:hypothetical protein
MQTQFHLRGKGHSGRAVRVEALAAHDAENMLTSAAKLAGPEATPIEIKKIEWRNGTKLFIKSYTEPTENPMAEGTKWKKPTPGQFDEMASYFTAKDCQVLESLYRDAHEITQKELEDIISGGLPVSGD